MAVEYTCCFRSRVLGIVIPMAQSHAIIVYSMSVLTIRAGGIPVSFTVNMNHLVDLREIEQFNGLFHQSDAPSDLEDHFMPRR